MDGTVSFDLFEGLRHVKLPRSAGCHLKEHVEE